MSDKHNFTVAPRQLLGRRVKKLRRENLTPANLFGKNLPSLNLQVDTKKFLDLHREVGESTLVYLTLENETSPRPVFIRAVTFHPVTHQLLHVDFHQVNLNEKITAPVPVKLVGEAPAERDKLGILVQQADEVEIEALPADMPDRLEVDVTGLVAEGDSILAKDIPLASSLTLSSDPEVIIAKIEPLAKEEIVAPPAPIEGEAAPAEAVEGEAAPVEAGVPPVAEEKKEK